MEFDILHATPGRLRVRCRNLAPTRANAHALRLALLAHEGVVKADFSVRTGNLLLVYSRLMPLRQAILLLLRVDPKEWRGVPPAATDETPAFETAVGIVGKKIVLSILRSVILPSAAQCALLVWKALPHLVKGLWSAIAGNVDAAVAEASTILYLLMRHEFKALRTFLHLASAAELLWGARRSGADGRPVLAGAVVSGAALSGMVPHGAASFADLLAKIAVACSRLDRRLTRQSVSGVLAMRKETRKLAKAEPA